MCGIAGFWDVRRRLIDNAPNDVIRRMTAAIRHRGPDDEGFFADQAFGIVLGHRRLSIVDLSVYGHQPMISPSGRYAIVFNGEVFNHARLRPELQAAGFSFKGHSDTEVMLAAIEHWGLEQAIKRFIGMFAFALWDRSSGVLTLCRDRLGIKPLYYGWSGGSFVFGSELKALTVFPGFNNPIDKGALCLLLRNNYIQAPYTIYERIYKLKPGAILRVNAAFAESPVDAVAIDAMTATYWSLHEVAANNLHNRLELPDEEAVAELDALLRDAVAMRMEADVPLGAFLSGGVDSSTVVALMQAQSTRPVQTFSIGFNGGNFDEAKFAKSVARHLGTDHHELYVSEQDAMDVVPQLPAMLDEPFADSSYVPTWLVSNLARSKVTVSLSGDGGDELFAGYNRYFYGGELRQWLDRIPYSFRVPLAKMLRGKWFAHSLERVMPHLPKALQLQNPGAKAGMLADMLGAASSDERYKLLVSSWRDPAAIVIGGEEPTSTLTGMTASEGLTNAIERMMYFDSISYLPGDILTKVDRASMSVGLEARVPLLDHRVVEFAWRVPLQQKIRAKQGKWLLRQVLYQYVPKELIERPKQGFAAPVCQWLRGPLRDWAESLLSKECLGQSNFFDPEMVRRLWTSHLEGRSDESSRLWSILTFQGWLSEAGRR